MILKFKRLFQLQKRRITTPSTTKMYKIKNNSDIYAFPFKYPTQYIRTLSIVITFCKFVEENFEYKMAIGIEFPPFYPAYNGRNSPIGTCYGNTMGK